MQIKLLFSESALPKLEHFLFFSGPFFLLGVKTRVMYLSVPVTI